MSVNPPSAPNFRQKIGYTRKEFGTIFQIYSQNVYNGLFRDFSFSEANGAYFISFKEEANKVPLITIQKKRLGPDRVLFTATSPGPKQQLIEVARSEKLDAFVRQVKSKIETLRAGRSFSSDKVKSMG